MQLLGVGRNLVSVAPIPVTLVYTFFYSTFSPSQVLSVLDPLMLDKMEAQVEGLIALGAAEGFYSKWILWCGKKPERVLKASCTRCTLGLLPGVDTLVLCLVLPQEKAAANFASAFLAHLLAHEFGARAEGFPTFIKILSMMNSLVLSHI